MQSQTALSNGCASFKIALLQVSADHFWGEFPMSLRNFTLLLRRFRL
jgi:hypothetical protein